MALFLHFLNREAYRAATREFSLRIAEDALRVLCLARSDEMYTNYANVLESGALSATGGAAIVRALLQMSQVLIEAERPTIDEFIESRAARYAFDSHRYPMYFVRDDVSSDVLRAHRVRTVSLTDHIANDIERLERREVNLSDVGVPPFDFPKVTSVIDTLWRAVQSRGDRAITRSLFQSELSSAVQVNAASRLISASYIRRHTEDLSADIVTGIPHLVVFDHLGSGNWSSDYPLLRELVLHCGLRPALSGAIDTDFQIASLRGTFSHLVFAQELAKLCQALRRRYGQSVGTCRPAVTRQLGSIGKAAIDPAFGLSHFERATAHLRHIASRLRHLDGHFAIAYEKEVQSMSKNCILVVTATKVETQALIESCKLHAKRAPEYLTRARLIALDLGDLNGSRLVNVQCEAGSVGPNGSQAVVDDAIREFSPDFIIMGGIAFGINSSKQKLGDVLIARTLVEYERAKVKPDYEIPRGQRIESSSKLLSAFRAAESSSLSDVTMQFGVMLSGEKLVDSSTFVEKLLEAEPEAIGGEMEGAGLAGAAHRHRVPWIVVKAIVDWGTGKAANSGEDHQREIARNAFDVIIQTILRIGL